jgi:hypothetical protein
MNAGEAAELKFIATLCCHISKSITFSTGQSLVVKQVQLPLGSLLTIPKSFPPNITPTLISRFSDLQLANFCTQHGIIKAGIFSKADIFINGVGYSIKYSNASPPALVNHTRRTGWEFVAQKKGISIGHLDLLIADYWQKRLNGTISEDVPNTHSYSPFNSHLNVLLPYLEYFIFEGTGSRISKHPASEIIEFSDPFNISSWKLLNKNQLVQSIWPRLVFSMRSGKGMPTNINSLTQIEKKSVLIWTKNVNGSLKGALHVRIR